MSSDDPSDGPSATITQWRAAEEKVRSHIQTLTRLNTELQEHFRDGPPEAKLPSELAAARRGCLDAGLERSRNIPGMERLSVMNDDERARTITQTLQAAQKNIEDLLCYVSQCEQYVVKYRQQLYKLVGAVESFGELMQEAVDDA